jgi:hypothetical protein
MICPRNFLRTADSDIIVSLHLVIPFISMGWVEQKFSCLQQGCQMSQISFRIDWLKNTYIALTPGRLEMIRFRCRDPGTIRNLIRTDLGRILRIHHRNKVLEQ